MSCMVHLQPTADSDIPGFRTIRYRIPQALEHRSRHRHTQN